MFSKMFSEYLKTLLLRISPKRKKSYFYNYIMYLPNMFLPNIPYKCDFKGKIK